MSRVAAALALSLLLESTALAVPHMNEPGGPKQIAGIVTADTGLAIAVTGAVLLGVSYKSGYDADDRDTLRYTGVGLLAAGGAALIAGTVVWIFGLREAKAAKQKPAVQATFGGFRF